MWKLRKRSTLTAVLVSLLVVVGVASAAGGAHANPWHEVDCSNPENRDPTCDLEAGNDQPGEVISNDGGETVCRWNGEEVPCVNDWGWFRSDGCYYQRVEGQTPPAGAETPGAGYIPQCIGDPPGTVRPAVWIPDSQAPGIPALSRIAVSRLVLPSPDLELSPPASAPQLVMLPTWLWIAPAWWTARSASASVPGITVTAVATPVRVRWSTGDGGEYVCDEGTPYTPDVDPAEESPDCGHIYTAPGVYQISAQVTWEVTWSGGGASGTEGPLSSSAALSVDVAESLTRNVGSRS